MPNIQTLENAFVLIEYREDEKQIFAKNKRDTNNEPALYTTHKRGIEKVWRAIEAHFRKLKDMEHADVMHVLKEHSIRYHYWCMVD